MLKYIPLSVCDNLYRGIAQLVEQWSPKPRVQSSSLCAPARWKSCKLSVYRTFYFVKMAFYSFLPFSESET